MRKKQTSFFVIILIILIAIIGCSKEKDASNRVHEENMIEDNKSSSQDTNRKVKPIEYLYNHDLNVIDDKYRNYYEIFLYSYCDSNNDGIGDINGLIKKLDYLNDGNPNTDSDLGINGIWLMPIMPSPSYHKYDVKDYYSIDPEYGTIEDFKNLIKECNKRGIKVIIDLVINHTSNENPWFTSAVETFRKEANNVKLQTCINKNKYCGYYNFAHKLPSEGDYHLAGDSGWYYEGKFVDTMPDLKLANKSLQKDIENIMSYWIDLGVGGFRLDAAKEYYSGNTDKNTEILRWLSSFVKSKNKDLYMVAEVWDTFSIFTKYYESGIDSIFNFSFAKEDGKIARTLLYNDSANSGKAFGEAMVLAQDTIKQYNENTIDAPFMTNHDTGRMAGILGYDENKIKLASAMNLFMSGSSFIYYGEEIGMSGSGRDENKRAPMVWSTTNKEGMTKGPGNMETVEHKFASVKDQLKDSSSILNYYKRALRLKNENPEIARGTVAYLKDVTDTDLCAISKEYNGSKLLMVYNISEKQKQVTLSKKDYGYKEIRGYLTLNKEAVTMSDDTITLPPYAIVILK